ncbi:hypothetical protein HBH69_125080 [Parastagonospora nodorum]|nr:hypothetical protein HBH69_125080 [Parastagonospora nodorum]KAH5690591.1 hypothetical protein HBI23_016320 [Parastagonospora nodorum]KAH6099444.1 hypothetical protein HBI65_069720 [Parastagonospora nodorum]KAH6145372.1 hypothetical protein HBI64_010280 [Parastagonospora nodorum]
MKLFFLLSALIAFVCADANFADWHPQGDGEVRSPCPALNSLANHGILPRDGHNLTVPILVKAMGEGLNVSPEVATSLSNLGMTLSKNPASGAFNLDDLNKHNAIEHDGSLSRKDIDLGGNEKLDADTFKQTLGFYKGASNIGLDEVAAARWGRVQNSKTRNSKVQYGDAQRFPSYFESSAYYQLFKDPNSSKARVDWIKVFFQEERMPVNEGWKPVNHIDGFSVAQVILQLVMRTPEKVTDATSPSDNFCIAGFCGLSPGGFFKSFRA